MTSAQLEEFRVQACKAPEKVITMNVSGGRGNSKEIFEVGLIINKLCFLSQCRVRMKLQILTHHLLTGRAFRKKCIFMDYIKFLFSIPLISLSSNLKLSIDIFMSVIHVFAEFGFIFVESASCLFSLFYKSTTFYRYCECTQIKVDPLQFRMMCYSYEQKLCILSCFH